LLVDAHDHADASLQIAIREAHSLADLKVLALSVSGGGVSLPAVASPAFAQALPPM
jgi:hypothetical protein